MNMAVSSVNAMPETVADAVKLPSNPVAAPTIAPWRPAQYPATKPGTTASKAATISTVKSAKLDVK
jgi:hypothetical protein